MSNVLRIARKEFNGFFSSPVAFIFLGSFLAATLFVFFWVATFFARNIADVRPLFAWMPVLLIFLVAAITMRMWAEERRAGTLEFLLTSPANPLQLVLGKFFACLGLVAVALLLTLPLPVTISMIGDLDWGPVIGGYLATLFLAAAYIAIGLFASARTDNQIVSLIATALICGLFYLLGTDTLTGLFGNKTAELLHLLGSGTRFNAITRGVIDLRDLYYYLSLVGIFLTLNVYTLERLRWAGNTTNSNHRRWALLSTLLAANFLAGNLWLAPITAARADITQGHIYSISAATRAYLAQLQEPLLIRGYFSAKTHPLLAPLVPRLHDLLEEYAVAGHGKVRVEFIDPQEHPELEREAGEKYGIRPVPFQFSSKYQSSVVNSYFDILIKYGDQYETLGFRDLIDVKSQGASDLQVDLRNPEYDITRAIKKVLYAYQGSGQLFANIPRPVILKAYISPERQLPKQLTALTSELHAIADKLQQESAGKFTAAFQDPAAGDGALARQLEQEYGFRPMAASLFDNHSFWFYITLESNGQAVQVPLPENLDKAGLERGIQAGLKRFSTGFLKTIALYTPPTPSPAMGRFGMPPGGKHYSWLEDKLREEHTLQLTDLKNGQVPNDADLLMVMAPESLDDKQRFAMDQFLMRGGTVVLAAAPYDITMRGALSARKHQTGLEKWLQHQGIQMAQRLVLDPQNAAFPIPVERNLGGFRIRETRMVDYPYFADIRRPGMGGKKGLTSGLDQVTFTWAAPITIDKSANQKRRVTRLLESSKASWTSDSLNIQPNFNANGPLGFTPQGKTGRQLLAVAVTGEFNSYYKGKASPLAKPPEAQPGAKASTGKAKKEAKSIITRVIEHSPDSARIILFSSDSFPSDTVLNLVSASMGTRYLKPVQLLENAVDWSLEDRGLLAIRGRAQFSRTLQPLDRNAQMFWEYLNYGLALAGLLLIWLLRHQWYKQKQARHQAQLQAGRA